MVMIGQIAFLSVGHSSSTDELIGKTVKVTNSLARGDVNKAAGQAIGGYTFPIARGSSVYASPSRVRIQQPVKMLGTNQLPLNLRTNYNAAVNPLHPTRIDQKVQVHSGNSYVSNTTTIPIPGNLKKE